ncbi:rSAM-modified peptide [Aquimarina sp. AD10]|uniref:class I lanthipeptide n=1 Tax=Aquimarina TaxID=290174 RepID=UPI000E4ECCF9|nr:MULTISPECIES: class I lanthipeptide [Aquimarina]AXT62176.1 rSAM-modified peptide [Aquimarina sp. AD10]RKM90629.1 rSAM-modified peptide [Aquimarina sp. AD10]
MKKLSLNKITVAKLSDKQLSNVQGGSNNEGDGGTRSLTGNPVLCNHSGSGDLIVKIQNAY